MSDEEKIEEETYSLIFSSLKHPIRRKIMRMLVHEPRTFSEILEVVSIDSGHLNYHLENLGDLITHSPDGKYRLSSVGVAAVKLMSGVEETPPIKVFPRSKGIRTLGVFTKIFLIILLIVLIASSLFFIGLIESYVVEDTRSSLGFVTILPNQSVRFNLTLVYNATLGYSGGDDFSMLIEKREPWVSTITEWKEGYLRFTYSEFNTSYMTSGMVYDASGRIIANFAVGGSPNQSQVFGLGRIITQPGTYITEIENGGWGITPELENDPRYEHLGHEPITGQIDWELGWVYFERPYFYWGIVGLLIVSIYPVLVLIRWILTLPHRRHDVLK